MKTIFETFGGAYRQAGDYMVPDIKCPENANTGIWGQRRARYDLLNAMELYDCTPSYSQACRLKKMSQEGRLSRWDIADVMSEEKANQRERLKIPMERVSKFFPSSYTPNQIEDEIVRICEERYRRRMSRDER